MEGISLLNPQGLIAKSELALMIHAIELMLIVVVPVYLLIIFFAWWYRAGNKKAKYMPDWGSGKMDELIWWAIPFEIILILGALTWTSTHQLDPRKPLDEARGKPLIVEVVALDWKWLFIYPEQNIATLNYVRVPVGRPVRFDVTADAPMNSFWIPQLGGQIYAMTGMVNELNLEADEVGKFDGGSANYSGNGFAQMKFVAEATSQNDFDQWVGLLKTAPAILNTKTYSALEKPSTGDGVIYYGGVEQNIYNNIVMTFMGSTTLSHTH